MSAISGTISGSQSILDTLDQIGVPIDISRITSTVERTVEVPVPDGVTIDPKVVTDPSDTCFPINGNEWSNWQRVICRISIR